MYPTLHPFPESFVLACPAAHSLEAQRGTPTFRDRLAAARALFRALGSWSSEPGTGSWPPVLAAPVFLLPLFRTPLSRPSLRLLWILRFDSPDCLDAMMVPTTQHLVSPWTCSIAPTSSCRFAPPRSNAICQTPAGAVDILVHTVHAPSQQHADQG